MVSPEVVTLDDHIAPVELDVQDADVRVVVTVRPTSFVAVQGGWTLDELTAKER